MNGRVRSKLEHRLDVLEQPYGPASLFSGWRRLERRFPKAPPSKPVARQVTPPDVQPAWRAGPNRLADYPWPLTPDPPSAAVLENRRMASIEAKREAEMIAEAEEIAAQRRSRRAEHRQRVQYLREAQDRRRLGLPPDPRWFKEHP